MLVEEALPVYHRTVPFQRIFRNRNLRGVEAVKNNNWGLVPVLQCTEYKAPAGVAVVR